MVNIVDRIIAKFGSQAAVAKAAGVTQAAVSQWRTGKFIPSRRQQRILNAAREQGIDLSPSDFFDLSAESETAA